MCHCHAWSHNLQLKMAKNGESKSKRFRGEPCSTLSCFALRLKPGQEIRECLINYAKDNNLEAPFVLSCVGSVTNATLRLANASRDTPQEVRQYRLIYCIVRQLQSSYVISGGMVDDTSVKKVKDAVLFQKLY